MSNRVLYSKINQLQSEELKKDLLLYVEFLLAKQTQKSQKVPKFGVAKGTFKMSADFDEPLEDFKEYMPS